MMHTSRLLASPATQLNPPCALRLAQRHLPTKCNPHLEGWIAFGALTLELLREASFAVPT